MRQVWISIAFSLMAVNIMFAEELKMTEKAVLRERGLVLQVEYRKEYIKSTAIKCKMSFTNDSEKTVTYGHISKYRDFDIRVTLASGDPVSKTAYGEVCLSDNEGQRKKWNVITLQPGNSFSSTMDLAQLFDLSVVGIYHLHIARSINEDTINEITIGVLTCEFTIIEKQSKNQIKDYQQSIRDVGQDPVSNNSSGGSCEISTGGWQKTQRSQVIDKSGTLSNNKKKVWIYIILSIGAVSLVGGIGIIAIFWRRRVCVNRKE